MNQFLNPMKSCLFVPRLACAVLLCCWQAAHVARGQSIVVANAGFESNTISPGGFAVLVPQGWAVYDPSSIINQNANSVGIIRPDVPQTFFPTGAPEGVNAALVFLAGPQTAVAGLRQTLAATLQADRRYRCSVQVGNIASGTSLPGSSDGGGVFYDLNGFPGYRIDVLAGTNVIGSDSNSIAATIPEGEWREARLHFDVTNSHPQLGQALSLRLVNLKFPATPGSPNIEVDFDDVRLSSGPIPVAAELDIALAAGTSSLQITGTTGATYRVEYSPVLPATNWLALTNILMNSPVLSVSDSNPVAGQTARFYRAVLVD
jgi:hapalindole H/12-epi-hapalindole U/12-epi-fischerindole U synthase